MDLYVITGMDASELVRSIPQLEVYSYLKYDSVIADIKNRKLTLVSIVPSVGADIMCLCRSVELYRGNHGEGA